MNNTAKRSSSLILYFLVALLLVLVAFLLHRLFHGVLLRDRDVAADGTPIRSVILDAGHGGFDGGAVSVTGTPEKTLNLEMSLTLAALLRAQGYEVILSREEDVELTHSDGGSRKMQDLRARLQLTEDHPGVPLISIHMNKFPQSRYHGLQVYHATGDETSKTLAERVQSTVKAGLQPHNDRAVKPATSAIFLLHRTASPAILVECGFLSNEEEARRLEDPVYRASLCLLIASAYGAWEAER